MNFSSENMGKNNVMKTELISKCSICNKETNYLDYWSNNKFCSIECKDKYYAWIKRHKDSIL